MTIRQPRNVDVMTEGRQLSQDWLRYLLDLQAEATSGREILTEDRTYYVRTDGSNDNNGRSNDANGAFLTIQKAIDVVVSLDCNVYDVVIQVADGTYAGYVGLKAPVGTGTFYIRGNTTTPANVKIALAAGACVGGVGKWFFEGVEFSNTTGIGILIGQGGEVSIDRVEFGTCGGAAHIYVADGGIVYINGNYEVTGGSGQHFVAEKNGIISGSTHTITVTGTPAFAIFAYAVALGGIALASITITGSATGTRYFVGTNAVINTFGQGATYFPGNVAGSTATGGQYA